jgi:hypothetical protein
MCSTVFFLTDFLFACRRELVDMLRSGYLDDLDLDLASEEQQSAGLLGSIKSVFAPKK